MTRLQELIDGAFDAVVISFLAAAASFFLILEWRQTKGAWFVGAWCVGIIIGLAAQKLGVPAGFDILITALAVITAPVTVNAIRHNTLWETIEEYRRRVRGDKDPPDPPAAA